MRLDFIFTYLILVNAAGFLLMLIDKLKAKRGAWRIPEATLMGIALLGGSIGVDEYASIAGLNRNESLARTGKRVPRVYMEDGQVVSCVLPLE